MFPSLGILVLILIWPHTILATYVKYMKYYQQDGKKRFSWRGGEIADDKVRLVVEHMSEWSADKYMAKFTGGILRVWNKEMVNSFDEAGAMFAEMEHIISEHTRRRSSRPAQKRAPPGAESALCFDMAMQCGNLM